MFGISLWKIGIVLAIGLTIVGYFKYTQDELARLNQEVATKDFALKATTATLEKTQADLKEQQAIAQKTYDDYQAARSEVDDIQQKFTKNNRDLGAFAASKPTELQKRMNDATAKSFRCIEDTVNKGAANVEGC
jgi:peptidoglycan hydrolase CwlO-like protein